MKGPIGRQRLAAAIDAAIADKVCGSPFFIVDGEPFFGADRLDQIAWRLSPHASCEGFESVEDGPGSGASPM